jgi:copper chaperone
MTERTLTVSGMSCGGCEQNVEDALAALDGVSGVEADHEGDAVELVTEGGVADDDIRAAVEDAGYEVPT